ncbi:hypothetical protein H8E07_09060 [bacterium]|nr:hypothetical protein [bacterium]
MTYEYQCPHCHKILNPNKRVILLAIFGELRGLVLMSSQLGDYQLICDKGFCSTVQAGDKVDFHCPVCTKSLTSETMEHFSELVMIDTDKPEKDPARIRFSRICDEQATFIYDGDSVQEYGKEARTFHDLMKTDENWGW